jgi:hypothetical protein
VPETKKKKSDDNKREKGNIKMEVKKKMVTGSFSDLIQKGKEFAMALTKIRAC